MKRILIIGNAGSGKTTFAKKLAKKTGLPIVHLDKLYWTGNWQCLERDKFDSILQKELEKEEWIIDGNFNRTIMHRLKYCDTVFYFNVPTVTCLWGITKRIIQNHGKTRTDMGGNCPEYFDRQKLKLYRNVIYFKKQNHRRYCDILNSAKGVEIVRFDNRKQADEYLNRL
ncbi:MAG: isopentenyl transferase family protein [Clostridia bacterium]|nr:isopentenyl transferase family protein [Clostridia bacterium]